MITAYWFCSPGPCPHGMHAQGGQCWSNELLGSGAAVMSTIEKPKRRLIPRLRTPCSKIRLGATQGETAILNVSLLKELCLLCAHCRSRNEVV